MTKILIALVLCLLVFTLIGVPSLASDPVPVLVSVGAPATVLVGGTFDVYINISTVANLKASWFDLGYDQNVFQLVGAEGGPGVTQGLIGGSAFPIDGWAFQPAGTPSGNIRVLEAVDGINVVNGAGYLAQLHFNVIGTAGQSSVISLSNVSLFDNNAVAIMPLALANGSVTVIGLPPPPPPHMPGVSFWGILVMTFLMGTSIALLLSRKPRLIRTK